MSKLPLGNRINPQNMAFKVGAWWPSGRVSDSRARGRGFDIYRGRVVSLSKDTFTL